MGWLCAYKLFSSPTSRCGEVTYSQTNNPKIIFGAWKKTVAITTEQIAHSSIIYEPAVVSPQIAIAQEEGTFAAE